jgi:alpha-galactosidase
MDPLTSAVLTLKDIRAMVGEMLEAESEWLPQFAGRKPRATPVVHIPANVQRAEVPIDPALAVFSRFGELAK